MWQRGGHLGAGWASTAGVHHIRGSATRDQRHPLQEASSWLFPVKSLSRQPWCVEISGTISHQPSSILLLDGSVSLNSEQLDRKPAKPCEVARSFSLKSWIFATLPKSDRAVTVKGVGDEVDTGPMTVVTSQLYNMAVFFLPSASFHFSLFSSLTLCRYDTLPPWLYLHHSVVFSFMTNIVI